MMISIIFIIMIIIIIIMMIMMIIRITIILVILVTLIITCNGIMIVIIVYNRDPRARVSPRSRSEGAKRALTSTLIIL